MTSGGVGQAGRRGGVGGPVLPARPPHLPPLSCAAPGVAAASARLAGALLNPKPEPPKPQTSKHLIPDLELQIPTLNPTPNP